MTLEPRKKRPILPIMVRTLAACLLVGSPLLVSAQDAEMSRPQKAYKQYTKAVQKAPGDATNWYNLGLACILLEKWDEAVAACSKSVELNSENARAHFRLGEALSGSGKKAEAVPHFEQAIALDDTLAPAHASLAEAYMGAGRHADAIKSYKRTLKNLDEGANPTGLYTAIGDAYFRLKDNEKAVSWFERTLEVAPDDPTTHFNLGATYRRIGMEDTSFLEKSARAFARAAELSPNDARTQFLAAETFIFADKASEAAPYLDRYFQLDPDGAKTGADDHAAAKEYREEIARSLKN